MTFSCLSIFSFLNCCFSLRVFKKFEALSPIVEPEDNNNSCALVMRATHETSKDKVRPNRRLEVNNSRLPIKLKGTINTEDIFDPINPPPS